MVHTHTISEAQKLAFQWPLLDRILLTENQTMPSAVRVDPAEKEGGWPEQYRGRVLTPRQQQEYITMIRYQTEK